MDGGMTKDCGQELCRAIAEELKRANEKVASLSEALGKAISEADGWHDDSHGGECPGLDAERKLLASIK